jgi:hypothetical protein
VALTDWSTDVLGIVTRDLFLRSSRIHSTLLCQRERLLHTVCHEHVYVVCIRFLMQNMLDLNRRDSRI